jgi:REP element-mobilizing transposase RayT
VRRFTVETVRVETVIATIFVMDPLRIEVPGGYYHLSTRGNNRRVIFDDDLDRTDFLRRLNRVAAKYQWTLLAYCLMDNHYHLIVQLGDLGMSDAMCELNGGYARTYNKRHRRSNHLFGRRYWDALMTTEQHLLECCRYVVLNPVRAGICELPAEWSWSSYAATVGRTFAPSFLATDELLQLFGRRPDVAREAYERFVREGREIRQPPWRKARDRVT